VGGVDKETEEDFRTRVLERLRAPSGGGNWAHVNATAEQAATQVQKAFCYPMIEGPGTEHIAVTSAPTDTNKHRDVADSVLTTVRSALTNLIPGHVNRTVTSVENQALNVSIGLSIPNSLGATPPGRGGGWVSGVVFPQHSSVGYVQPYLVNSSTVFNVNSDLQPQDDISKIAWLSPLTWTLHRATVVNVTSLGSNNYQITIDTPFPGLTTSHWVMPDAERLQDYVDVVFDWFGSMGPGEKTDEPAFIQYAMRQPESTESWNAKAGPGVLQILVRTGDEVSDGAFLYRSATSPDLPALVTDAPSIFVPGNIAFYPLGE
jgi:hypothetical protein